MKTTIPLTSTLLNLRSPLLRSIKMANPLAIAKLSYQKEPTPITPKVEAAMMNLTLPATDEEQSSVTDEDPATGKDDNSTTDDNDNSNIDKGFSRGLWSG